VAALAAAAPASAGLIGTGQAAYCDPTVSQPFAPWDDDAYYRLAPGGSFEPGTPSWSLTGDARIVPGNESFFVGDSNDKKSLFLPAGSSATSPSTCFNFGDWHLRFFVANRASTGRLKVTLVVRSLLGVLSVIDGGTVSAGSTWEPSPRIELTISNVTSLVGTAAVQVRLTPVGADAAFQVDDLYVDPWVSS
jgi:hypothetical protein